MSTKALFAIGGTLALAGALYAVSGATPSTGATWLGALMVYFAAASWLRWDARRHHVPLAYDWGWLMILGWPFLWVWYARRTGRGWAATIALTALPTALALGAAGGLVVRSLLFATP